MNAITACPFPHLRWTPQQLIDAVPLRLFELDLFSGDRRSLRAANRPGLRVRCGSYLPPAGLPRRFRVRG